MTSKKYANFRDARMIGPVLKVEVNEGEGTGDDPLRRVVYLLHPRTGKVLGVLNEDREREFAGGDQMYDYSDLL